MSCAALLIVLGHYHLLPAPDLSAALSGALTGFGVVSAIFYAAGLAFGAESLARTTVSLLYVEEDRYRLLARNMSDHDFTPQPQRRGAVRLPCGRDHGRRAGRPPARSRPVRPRPCRRFVRPISPRCRMPPATARHAASNSGCGAIAPRGQARYRRFHLGRDAVPAARAGID